MGIVDTIWRKSSTIKKNITSNCLVQSIQQELEMRDYVLSQAQSRQLLGLVPLLRRMARNWKHQRDLRNLLKLEDYLLRDMGLTRPLLMHLANQPLTIDLDWERERVLRGR
jgi:uncharacterized protein YjiS (DUF1127 family)